MKRLSSKKSKDLDLLHELETQAMNAITQATAIPANMCENSFQKSITDTKASIEYQRNALLDRLPSDVAKILKRKA